MIVSTCTRTAVASVTPLIAADSVHPPLPVAALMVTAAVARQKLGVMRVNPVAHGADDVGAWLRFKTPALLIDISLLPPGVNKTSSRSAVCPVIPSIVATGREVILPCK